MGKPTSRIGKVRVPGPLAPFATAFESALKHQGYRPLTIVNEMRVMANLSRWLDGRGETAGDLSRERIEQFLDARRAAGFTSPCSRRALATLAEVLAEHGVARVCGSDEEGPTSATEALLASFERFLRSERGLAATTAAAYAKRAHRFLAASGVDGQLARLNAGHVTGAVTRECATGSVGSVQYFVAALRSFLRFCFMEGLTESDLSAAALGITGRRHSSLPRGIDRKDAEALLASCDRRRSEGRRDYAIVIMLARMGLRAGEVARLRLEDIDWEAGEVVVHGKGNREDRLPLPSDVGAAIAGYLRRGRPRSAHREVFLRALAPIGPLGRGGVSSAVRRACRRGGLAPVGAHRLRHTLACEMVAAGVPLAEIGQVLRHRGVSSTAIYARVDLEGLRALARPWPGEGL